MSLDVDLSVHIGALADEVRRLRKTWEGKPEVSFIELVGTDISGSQGAAPASGAITFNLGSPEQGFEWLVRSMLIGGAKITSAVAGTGYVFACGADPTKSLQTIDARDFTALGLPQKAFYGRGELHVDATENLWVVISGGTQNTQYACVALAEQIELGAALYQPYA